ncbi:hypothetical protein [Flavobacterium sp.]|uniref:hypothetical protein n=1 Tax=Flavobacterium sp. TaxID=239 RepID=UPI002629C27F|nr:hypothetical protein [Flavobacterium sp.]
MKIKNCCLLFTIVIALFSCSSDHDNPNPQNNEPIENIVIELNTVRDIFPTWAKFNGTIAQNSDNNRLVGFVYSTAQNPVVDNSNTNTVSDFRSGNATFEFSPLSLLPNTTYYIKAFVKKADNSYLYSAEYTFKTTGYFGPAGGYVAYDKGTISDGWRYMEIHPTTLNYSSSGVGGQWGNMSNFIASTYPDFGKGLENTMAIVNGTTDANCAAKLCYNLTLNGYSDWFLPSIQELYQMSTELRKAGISIHYSAWSSTQVDADFANCTSNTLSDPSTIIINMNSKAMSEQILPVRRY